jgi:chromosome segregation ATPase
VENAEENVANIEGEIAATGVARTEKWESDLANKAGMSVEELKEYSEYLQEIGEISGETAEQNLELAATYARIQKGLKTAKSSLQDYAKILKTTAKDSVEHKNALDDMKEMYGDALDLDDKGVKALTEDFMTQEDVMKDLQDAADGVDGAYDRLQEKATNHILDQLTGDADISGMADEIQTLSTAVN